MIRALLIYVFVVSPIATVLLCALITRGNRGE